MDEDIKVDMTSVPSSPIKIWLQFMNEQITAKTEKLLVNMVLLQLKNTQDLKLKHHGIKFIVK